MSENLFDSPENEDTPKSPDDEPDAYRVIARRYRPSTFSDVIGQEHVTRTLKNAIREDRLGHAYLFSGPRGIGKTSTARILARAVNCEDGVSPEPCNECSVCRKLEIGSTPDIVEIDAASQRGIDDIRNLRETVRYAPLHSNYRVYIIDESHMLSQDAFNAFLKTLEEPPDHVLFVFATTEPEKMPETIISRCQPFRFNRISHGVMLDRLREIVEEEEIEVEEGILSDVCRAVDGSLRDAQSILDQLISIAEDGIDESDLKLVLGTVSSDTLNNVLNGIARGNPQSVLEQIDEIYQGGGEIDVFLEQFVAHLRDLLVVHSCGADTELIEAGETERRQLDEQSGEFSRTEVSDMIESLVRIRSRTRNLYQSRLLLETELVRLCERNRKGDQSPKKKPESAADEVSNTSSPNDSIRDAEPDSSASSESNEPAVSDNTSTREPEESPSESIPSSIESVRNEWDRVLDALRDEHSTTAALVEEGTPAELDGTTVVIQFSSEYNYHLEKLSDGERNQHLISALRSELHPELDVRVEPEPEETEERTEQETEEGTEPNDSSDDRRGSGSSSDGLENNPDVQKAIDFFDADIVNTEE